VTLGERPKEIVDGRSDLLTWQHITIADRAMFLTVKKSQIEVCSEKGNRSPHSPSLGSIANVDHTMFVFVKKLLYNEYTHSARRGAS
jgi:hypothetical protein